MWLAASGRAVLAGGGREGRGWRRGGAGGAVVAVERWGWRRRDGRCWGVGFGGREAARAVRMMAVVMVNELGQHVLKVPAVGDQDPVQALASDGAHEPLGDRVCLRRPGRGV